MFVTNSQLDNDGTAGGLTRGAAHNQSMQPGAVGTQLCIKIISKDKVQDAETVRRLSLEIKVLRYLRHPNIAYVSQRAARFVTAPLTNSAPPAAPSWM